MERKITFGDSSPFQQFRCDVIDENSNYMVMNSQNSVTFKSEKKNWIELLFTKEWDKNNKSKKKRKICSSSKCRSMLEKFKKKKIYVLNK